MNTKRVQRGFSLIEVFAALAVLGISMLGLTAGLIVAASSTSIAAQRTLMLQFAQSRLERLLAETRTKIPTKDDIVGGVSCCARMDPGGTFNPNAAPGTEEFTHTLKVFLVDPAGVVREIYSTAYLMPRMIVNDMRTLALEGRPTRTPR